MKVAQITQFLLTLVSTIAAVEAYDAPSGYGYLSDDNTQLTYVFILPKSNFKLVNIYCLMFVRNIFIQTANVVYQPGNSIIPNRTFWNDTGPWYDPWLSATDVELGDNFEYSEIIVTLPTEYSLEYYNRIPFFFSLNGPEGEQSFPANIPVFANDPSSTISQTATSSLSNSPTSSLTPYCSAYYHEDHAYYDFFLPKYNFSQIEILPVGPVDEFQTASGVYQPSGSSFEVSVSILGSGSTVGFMANTSFSEEDEYAIVSVVSLKSSSSSEYASIYWISYGDIYVEEGLDFFITFVVTSSSPRNSPTTCVSSTVPTTVPTPFGSAYFTATSV